MRLIEAVFNSVRRYPNNLALVDEKRSLTYRELWSEVQDLAEEVSSQERRAYVLKGPRSVSLVVRFFAVLKANHIPLLLDPCTPDGRLRELQTIVKSWSEEGVEYLATTSGSSGLPKLVRVGFSCLYSVVRQQIKLFELSSDSRSAWVLSPGFDASLSDIGTALCCGATLFCGPRGVEGFLPEYLSQHEISYIDIPPSVLALYRPEEFPASLETIVVGGEPSDPKMLRDWSRHHRVVAVYGPAEATVCSSMSVVDEGWDRPYLGRPLEGVEYRFLEDELLIGGNLLGRGYLDSDFGEWYSTGDLVGDSHPVHGLEFLGRKDRQVQLHGQRVELDEIESRAARILGHRNVAVMEQAGGLVLAWQPAGCEAQEKKALRDRLSQQLLPAWLPRAYVALDSLPRSASQKLDRKALAALLGGELSPDLDSLASLDLLLRLERSGVTGATQWAQARKTLALDQKCLIQALPEVRPTCRPFRQSPSPRLLITGLTGRLGRALEPLLTGFEVRSLTRRPQGPGDILADFEQSDFGISIDTWRMLKEQTDLVLNLAGQLDLSQSFESLKRVNALSLARLTELACPIHHASSLAVTLSAEGTTLFGGYAQSKWLAEQILVEWPGVTFQLGHLLGSPDKKELLALVIRGLRDLGLYPRSTAPFFFDITPTDWAAQILRDNLLQSLDNRQTKSVRRGWQASYQDLTGILAQSFTLREVAPAEFFASPAPTPASAIAQRALWRFDESGVLKQRWRDFDLFLLSNSQAPLESTRAAREELERYIVMSNALNF